MPAHDHANAAPELPFRLCQANEPFLLAADVDGTMLGDGLGELWLNALRRISGGAKPGFLLAYVTGRDLSSVTCMVDEGRLPPPDFICGEVGTWILDTNDPDSPLGQRYLARVSPQWDPEAIYALGEGEGVRRQASLDGKALLRAGFDWDGQPRTLEAFYRRIAGLEHCYAQASHSRYIDVLPNALGKGKAVEFLQIELGLDTNRVVVAGDSGNDREMFLTPFKGILPANALEELRSIARQPWHYHSALPAGRGVLDGLRYFGFLAEE